MPKKFKPNHDPEFPFATKWNEELLEKYKDKIEILEKAIGEGWSINKLIEELGELNVELGGNCSGVDVAKLDSMEVESWTW